MAAMRILSQVFFCLLFFIVSSVFIMTDLAIANIAQEITKEVKQGAKETKEEIKKAPAEFKKAGKEIKKKSEEIIYIKNSGY